jgi:hypothetical protein
MKPQGGKSIQGPLLRGLAGRSATGQNDQAAAEQMWRLGLGAGCQKNIPAIPAGRSVFLLDIPSRPSDLAPDRTDSTPDPYTHARLSLPIRRGFDREQLRAMALDPSVANVTN